MSSSQFLEGMEGNEERQVGQGRQGRGIRYKTFLPSEGHLGIVAVGDSSSIPDLISVF